MYSSALPTTASQSRRGTTRNIVGLRLPECRRAADSQTTAWAPRRRRTLPVVRGRTSALRPNDAATRTAVRRAGAAILALAAIAVWFLMAPEEPEIPVVQTQEQVADRSREIAEALSDYELNETLTQGAPQQAVVNGWVTKDLLTIMASQQNDALTREEIPPPVPPVAPGDGRIPALVGLLVLGLALAVATPPRPPARDGSTVARRDEAAADPALSPAPVTTP